MTAADDSLDDLVVEQRGATLLLRLNRPAARNALTAAMLGGFAEALQRAESDPNVRAVVITGTGDRAFCAGMDLRSFGDNPDQPLGDPAATEQFVRLIHGEVRVPVIAAINASAIAGGFELMMGCDIVVASSEAKFGLPEVKRGLIPGGSGTLLGTRLPLAVALELLMTGDTIDVERAYQLGLVNAVVPADQVLDRALQYADRITANGPLAVGAVKELARLAVQDAGAARRSINDWQPRIFSSADAKEGALAYMEKRDPVWQGR